MMLTFVGSVQSGPECSNCTRIAPDLWIIERRCGEQLPAVKWRNGQIGPRMANRRNHTGFDYLLTTRNRIDEVHSFFRNANANLFFLMT